MSPNFFKKFSISGIPNLDEILLLYNVTIIFIKIDIFIKYFIILIIFNIKILNIFILIFYKIILKFYIRIYKIVIFKPTLKYC